MIASKIGDYQPTFRSCPFCGSQPHYSDDIDPGDQPGAYMRIECYDCSISMYRLYKTYFPISRESSRNNETLAYDSKLQAQQWLEQDWNKRHGGTSDE
jgi:hypothetical protein